MFMGYLVRQQNKNLIFFFLAQVTWLDSFIDFQISKHGNPIVKINHMNLKNKSGVLLVPIVSCVQT